MPCLAAVAMNRVILSKGISALSPNIVEQGNIQDYFGRMAWLISHLANHYRTFQVRAGTLRLKDDDHVKLHIQHSFLHQPRQCILKVINQPERCCPHTRPDRPIAEIRSIPIQGRACPACSNLPFGESVHNYLLRAHWLACGQNRAPQKRHAILKRSDGLLVGTQGGPQSYALGKELHRRKHFRPFKVASNRTER